MIRTLSAREQRLVALLILVALVAAAIMLVIQPIADGFAARRAERDALLARYARNAATIAAVPRLARQAARQKAALANFALAARDPAAAQDMLRDRLQSAVTQVGGDFRATQEATAPTGWAAIRLEARLTIEQLVALLRSEQNATPFIIVDTLAIAADDALVTGRPIAMEVVLEAKIPLRRAAAR